MKEEKTSDSKSWIERISDKFSNEPRTQEDLLVLLRDAEQRGLLDADALAMIEGVLQVSEMQVRDVMVPRSQMVVVERDSDPEDFLPTIIESGHSRFPIIGDNRDEVVGILLAKDMLPYFAGGKRERFDVRDSMRSPVFIPESKRLNVLLKEFRSNRNHMAIVVDEYGGIAGLVTIEDVIEQIVGEIEDEFDIDEDGFIKAYSNTKFSVKALTPIEDFNEYFETAFSDDEYDTVGGLVLNHFGHMPKRGEKVNIQGLDFTVLRADNRRIHLIQVSTEQKLKNASTASSKQSEY
jgi:magnesium and cobalt transporter